MTTYSHSRISTFDQCRYKYKLQYIDKVKVDIPTTIECFMGDMVHQALEKLYSMLKFEKTMGVEEVIVFYNQLWAKEYVPEILVAKADQGLTSEDYRKMGEKFLIDYYFKHQPFNDLTIIGLETQDKMDLPNGDQWHVRIDKLGRDKEGNYYVCDYKTNSRMKMQEDADEDKQLAMYSVWVRDKFPGANKVVLKWHMLAFNADVESSRSDEDLKKLQNEIVEKITEIEAATEFPTNKTALCNYCVFKNICPVFGHNVEN
jgi:putative RecB family exonuclease